MDFLDQENSFENKDLNFEYTQLCFEKILAEFGDENHFVCVFLFVKMRGIYRVVIRVLGFQKVFVILKIKIQ